MNTKHLADYRAALAQRATTETKLRTRAGAVAKAQADVAELEERASEAAAVFASAGIEEAQELGPLVRKIEDAITAARRILREARDAQAHAVVEDNSAQERARQARTQLRKDHVNEVLVARLNAVRAEEREICFRISEAQSRSFSTPAADAALDAPPARPTSMVTRPTPGLVADFNTPLGTPREPEDSKRYWHQWDAELDRTETNPGEPSRERAA